MKEWLDKAAGELPPLPKQAIKALVSSYHEMLERAIRDQLFKKAQRDAAAIAESIALEVTSEPEKEQPE